jgi:hypothetical protein
MRLLRTETHAQRPAPHPRVASPKANGPGPETHGHLLVTIGSLLGAVGCRENAGLSVKNAERFRTFGLYYLGESFRGLPLTYVGRGSGRGPKRDWAFIYGSCEPSGGGGCSPPLDVQNHSVCRRFPALYGEDEPDLIPIRGAMFTRGSGTLYTGRTAVVINGSNTREVIQALRPVGSPAGAKRRLAPPNPGAVEGRLPCQRGKPSA